MGLHSASADPVSEDKPIAVIHAGSPASEKTIVKRKDVTGKVIRGKKPTAMPKIVAGTDLAKTAKKTWMIHLQQLYPKGL